MNDSQCEHTSTSSYDFNETRNYLAVNECVANVSQHIFEDVHTITIQISSNHSPTLNATDCGANNCSKVRSIATSNHLQVKSINQHETELSTSIKHASFSCSIMTAVRISMVIHQSQLLMIVDKHEWISYNLEPWKLVIES